LKILINPTSIINLTFIMIERYKINRLNYEVNNEKNDSNHLNINDDYLIVIMICGCHSQGMAPIPMYLTRTSEPSLPALMAMCGSQNHMQMK